MNSLGIVSSPGNGRIIAELLTYGESEFWNPYNHDSRRLPPGSNNKFLNEKTAPATLSAQYAFVYPDTTYKEYPRDVKNSPLHEQLTREGAVWNQLSNWEIPRYFNREGMTWLRAQLESNFFELISFRLHSDWLIIYSIVLKS